MTIDRVCQSVDFLMPKVKIYVHKLLDFWTSFKIPHVQLYSGISFVDIFVGDSIQYSCGQNKVSIPNITTLKTKRNLLMNHNKYSQNLLFK